MSPSQETPGFAPFSFGEKCYVGFGLPLLSHLWKGSHREFRNFVPLNKQIKKKAIGSSDSKREAGPAIRLFCLFIGSSSPEASIQTSSSSPRQHIALLPGPEGRNSLLRPSPLQASPLPVPLPLGRENFPFLSLAAPHQPCISNFRWAVDKTVCFEKS